MILVTGGLGMIGAHAAARSSTSDTTSSSPRTAGQRSRRSSPAFDVAAAVADYVAWRADNPR